MNRSVLMCAIVGVLSVSGVAPRAQTAPSQPASLATQATAELARKKNCLGCHTVADARTGPSYQQVAARYAGDAQAAGKLAAKIRAGGSGTWGPLAMPPQTQVTEAEAAQLVGWILAQKSSQTSTGTSTQTSTQKPAP